VKITIDPKYPQAVGIANILERVVQFGNCHWEILRNEEPDCPFFTSDFPVGNEPSTDARVLNRVLPLSPDLAVRIQPDLNLDRTAANFEFKKFSYRRRFVRRQEAIAVADLSPDFQHLSAVGSVVQRGWRSGQATRATYSRSAPPDQSARSARRARPLKRTALLAKPVNGINAHRDPTAWLGM
jgi:hypothetical protein